MMNIQADNQVIDEILGLIKFNDSILRHIILQRTKAYTESSVMMNREKTNKEEAH